MSRNVSGQAYALTVLTPILDGHAAELTAHLDALPEGAASPLARVAGTHLGRWVVIDQVKYMGHGQRHRDSLSAARLLFTANLDGDVNAYLERLQTGLGEDADAIWGHCRGYPGRGAGFAPWKRNSTCALRVWTRMRHDDAPSRRCSCFTTSGGPIAAAPPPSAPSPCARFITT